MPWKFNPFTGQLDYYETSVGGEGSGDVVGPGSATDNAIARYDSTTGKLIQNSGATVDDTGNIAGNNLSGTNTGDQTITLTGNVTGTGTGTFAATIANDAVTLAKMADMATASFIGRNTAGTGDPEVLSVATTKTLLNLTGTNSGDVTIAAFGNSPTANAASISGQAITIQPADSTRPGALSVAAQDVKGVKTFLDNTIHNSSADMAPIATPSAPASGIRVYSKIIGGRPIPAVRGPLGAENPIQYALFRKRIGMIMPGVSTVPSVWGIAATINGATISHGVDETFGHYWNSATSAVDGNASYVSQNLATIFRGSAAGANGFHYTARFGTPDATTDSRIFVGLTNQTTTAPLDSDDPAGHRAGISFSTDRADTHFMFTTKDGTTEDINTTSMVYTTDNIYFLSMFCGPEGTSIAWEIINETAGTSQSGSTTTRLPGGSTALRMYMGIEACAATAKNLRGMKMYFESDR